VLSGALGRRSGQRREQVQWIPPRWDWVDPLKDIQAQVLAMEAGITSRRKVVEATGYDIEEVDRENAADAARATGSRPALPHEPRRDAGCARDAGDPGPSLAMAPATTRTTALRRPIRSPTGVTTWQAGMRSAPGGPARKWRSMTRSAPSGSRRRGSSPNSARCPRARPSICGSTAPAARSSTRSRSTTRCKRHEGTVTVWIDGIAASAASYVAMAGDEIVMPENAFLMIHDPAGLVMGHGRRHARHGRGARQGEGQPRLGLRREIRPDARGGRPG
jgi:hypothetical protein